MDKIEKFLRKVPSKDRRNITFTIYRLKLKDFEGIDIKKLQNSRYLRARVGRYRIIFCYIENRLKVKDILNRNENTYKKK